MDSYFNPLVFCYILKIKWKLAINQQKMTIFCTKDCPWLDLGKRVVLCGYYHSIFAGSFVNGQVWYSLLNYQRRCSPTWNVFLKQFIGSESGCPRISKGNLGYPAWWTHILPWKDPPFLMGKSTISMAIFNCYVSSPEGMTDMTDMTCCVNLE